MTVRSAVNEWYAQAQPHELELGIVLEYAYRGVAAVGGMCHVERVNGCAICDALTSAETVLGWTTEIVQEERTWWEES